MSNTTEAEASQSQAYQAECKKEGKRQALVQFYKDEALNGLVNERDELIDSRRPETPEEDAIPF